MLPGVSDKACRCSTLAPALEGKEEEENAVARRITLAREELATNDFYNVTLRI
jgi:hypothetical protein